MADSSTAGAAVFGTDRMPLDAFSKSTPPGWAPKVKKYPFRRYAQLLRLWQLQTDLAEEAIGPAICGRLKGVAFQFALSLSAERLDLNSGMTVQMVALELFAEPAHGPRTNPATNAQYGAEPSGAAYLCTRLQERFSAEDQDLQWSALEGFFELFRGSASIEDFLNLHDLALQDATQSTGLVMNDTGRSYFLLRGAQLSASQHWDIRLRLNGDLTDYNGLRRLMQRMYMDAELPRNSTIPAMAGQYFQSDADYDPPGQEEFLDYYGDWRELTDDGLDWWYEDDGWFDADHWHGDGET